MADLTAPGRSETGGRWRDYARIARAYASRGYAYARQRAKTARAHKITLALPGLAGIGLVAGGIGMIYAPAGVIAAGLFLLRIDARL